MEEKKYKTIAAKVSIECAELVGDIAKMKDMTANELGGMVYDTLVRYMSSAHNLTPEMEQSMSVFEHLANWKDALNFADPTVMKEIGEATYYFYDTTGKKHGTRAVHVTRPWIGDWEQTENIQIILERALCLLTPERYLRLRRLAVDQNCSSLLQLFDKLLDFHGSDDDYRELREQFEDANRSEYGRTPAEAPFRRKHYKNPDTAACADSHLNFDGYADDESDV
jgi:hypothetical protein